MNRLSLILFLSCCVQILIAQPGQFNWKPVDGKDAKHSREKYRYRATFEKLDVPFRNYQFNASSGTEIQLESGTEIVVPSNAFITKTGTAHTGAVSLKYRELYHPSQIMSSGIPMYYGKPESFQNLQSAGMFEIEAWAGNQELFLKENKNIQVKLAAFDTTAYKQYYLEATGKQDVWRELKEAPIQINQKKAEALKKIQATKPAGNYFSLRFDTTENAALSTFQQLRWEYAGAMDDTNSPFKQAWVQQELWNNMTLNVEVDLTKENQVVAFPERYRTLRLLSNSQLITTFYTPEQEKTMKGKIACIQGAGKWESAEALRAVAIDVSGSGRWIAASDNTTLFLWDVTKGKIARILQKRKPSSAFVYTAALKFDEEKNKLIAISSTGLYEVFDLTTGAVISSKKLSTKKVFQVVESQDKSWFSVSYDYEFPDPMVVDLFTWKGDKIATDTVGNMDDMLLSNEVGKYAILNNKSYECLIKHNGTILHRIPLPEYNGPDTYNKKYSFNQSVLNNVMVIRQYNLGDRLLNWKGEILLKIDQQIQSVSFDQKYILLGSQKMKMITPTTRINKKFQAPGFMHNSDMIIRNVKTNTEILINAGNWARGNFYHGSNDLWIIQNQSVYKINPDTIDLSIKTLSVSNDLRDYRTMVKASDDVFSKAQQAQKLWIEQEVQRQQKSWEQQASFQRQFEVNQMGIYNVDKIAEAGNLLTRDIRFTNEGKALKKSLLLYQITGPQGNVVVKNFNASSITFSTTQPNNFILVLGDKMALISDAQFKQVLSSSSKALTIPVTFSDVPSDEKAFQAVFQGLAQ